MAVPLEMKKTVSLYVLVAISLLLIFTLIVRDAWSKSKKLVREEVPLTNVPTNKESTSEATPEEPTTYNQILLHIAPLPVNKELSDWLAFIDMKKMLNFAVKTPLNERLTVEVSLILYEELDEIEEIVFTLVSDPKLKLDTSFKLAFLQGYDEFSYEQSYQIRGMVSGRMIDRLDYAAPLLVNEKSVVLDTNLIVTTPGVSYVLAYWAEPIEGTVPSVTRLSLQGGVTVKELLSNLRSSGYSRVRALCVKVYLRNSNQ